MKLMRIFLKYLFALCFIFSFFCFIDGPCFAMSVRDIPSYNLYIDFDGDFQLTDNGVTMFHGENVAPGDCFLTDISIFNRTNWNVQFFIDNIVVNNRKFDNAVYYEIINQDEEIVYSGNGIETGNLAMLKPNERQDFRLKVFINKNIRNVIQGESAIFEFNFRVYSDDSIDVPKTGNLFEAISSSKESFYVFAIIGFIVFVLCLIYYLMRNKSKKIEYRNTKNKKRRGLKLIPKKNNKSNKRRKKK